MRVPGFVAILACLFTITGVPPAAAAESVVVSVRISAQGGESLGGSRLIVKLSGPSGTTPMTYIAASDTYSASVPAGASYVLSAQSWWDSYNGWPSSFVTENSRFTNFAVQSSSFAVGAEPISADIEVPLVRAGLTVQTSAGAPVHWSSTALVCTNRGNTVADPVFGSLTFDSRVGQQYSEVQSGADGVAAFVIPTGSSCYGQATRTASGAAFPIPTTSFVDDVNQTVVIPGTGRLSGLANYYPDGSSSVRFTTRVGGVWTSNHAASVSPDGTWSADVTDGLQNTQLDIIRSSLGWRLTAGSSFETVGDRELDLRVPLTLARVKMFDASGTQADLQRGTIYCTNTNLSGALGFASLTASVDAARNTVEIPPGSTCQYYHLDDASNVDQIVTLGVVPESGIYAISSTLTALSPPSSVSVASTVPGDRSVTVTWLRPVSDLPILGYTVKATPGGQSCSTESEFELSCAVSSLSNGVNYTFTVIARSGAGPSATSTPSASTVPGSAPDPVTGVVVEPGDTSGGGGGGSGDGTTVTIRWLAAASDPNYPVTGYVVTTDPGDQTCRTDGALFCAITGLIPGGDYHFTVRATNAIGSGGGGEVFLPGDVTPPVVTGAPDREPNASGWFRQPVTVSWTATDDHTPANQLVPPAAVVASIQGQDVQVESGPVCDLANNCARGRVSVSLDMTDPTISATMDRQPNGSGWYNAPVTVTFTCADALSGIDECTSPLVVDTDGTEPLARGSARDRAGNVATVAQPVSLDSTAPTVTPAEFSTNPAPVSSSSTAHFSVVDNLSGVQRAELWLDTDPGPGAGTPADVIDGVATLPLTNLPAGLHTVGVRAKDAAGNWSETATSLLVVYDPNGGFATGGGWIVPGSASSDPGDLLPGIDGNSKGMFGFSVRYRNGQSTVPEGDLSFRYRVGDFTLNSISYDWLVVTNSQWVHFQGAVSLNRGSTIYPVKLSARASNTQPDRLVLKVYPPGSDPSTATPLYQASGDVQGGRIMIHKA